MIPAFDGRGFLPSGIHDTHLGEIEEKLGGNSSQREKLFHGLRRYLYIWSRSGFISYVYIDGSFVTNVSEPQDVDLILVPVGTALESMDFFMLALEYSVYREEVKAQFGCDVIVVLDDLELNDWLTYFCHDRFGRQRGLLRVKLPL